MPRISEINVFLGKESYEPGIELTRGRYSTLYFRVSKTSLLKLSYLCAKGGHTEPTHYGWSWRRNA